nr:uncharacterized protein LOC105870370 [Microcebus murinus]
MSGEQRDAPKAHSTGVLTSLTSDYKFSAILQIQSFRILIKHVWSLPHHVILQELGYERRRNLRDNQTSVPFCDACSFWLILLGHQPDAECDTPHSRTNTRLFWLPGWQGGSSMPFDQLLQKEFSTSDGQVPRNRGPSFPSCLWCLLLRQERAPRVERCCGRQRPGQLHALLGIAFPRMSGLWHFPPATLPSCLLSVQFMGQIPSVLRIHVFSFRLAPRFFQEREAEWSVPPIYLHVPWQLGSWAA